jgi:4-amino-4-deoxy-L-arabinose transferase-like glycosyltransferase
MCRSETKPTVEPANAEPVGKAIPPADRRFFGVLALILLLAASLALPQMGRRSLWTDEFTTLEVSRLGWGEIASNRLAAGHFPTYFWVMKAWRRVFGESEWALRFPSLLLNLASVFVLALFVRRGAGNAPALWAALLYAIHQRSVWASLEARPYALSIFMTALLAYAMIAAVEKVSVARCALMVAAALGASTSHLSAIPVVAALGATVFLWGLKRGPGLSPAEADRERSRRHGRDAHATSKRMPLCVAVSSVVSVLLASASLFVLVMHRRDSVENDVGRRLDADHLTEAFGQVVTGEYEYLGGSSLRYVGVALGVAALGLLVRARRRNLVGALWFRTTLLWLASTFAFLGVSRVTGNVGETFRYYTVAVPSAMAIVAMAFASLRRKTVSAVALGLFAAFLAAVTAGYIADPGDGVRQAVEEIARRAAPSDVAIAYGPARHMHTAFEYYGPPRHAVEVVDRKERNPETLNSILERLAQPGRRLWFVLYKEETPRGKRAAILEAARTLTPRWSEIERLEIGKVKIYLWAESASTTSARVNDAADR